MLKTDSRFQPRLSNGPYVLALISELESTVASLKNQISLMIFEGERGTNDIPGEAIRELRKQLRLQELGLRLRAGDPRAGRSLVQRQRALKAVKKMRAAGFPNLQKAWAAKATKAAERRASKERE